jgi:hypothetical protein
MTCRIDMPTPAVDLPTAQGTAHWHQLGGDYAGPDDVPPPGNDSVLFRRLAGVIRQDGE